MDHDDIAYGIIEDYLNDGPDYFSIRENVEDNDGDDSDAEQVARIVRETLTRLATEFNTVGGFD